MEVLCIFIIKKFKEIKKRATKFAARFFIYRNRSLVSVHIGFEWAFHIYANISCLLRC